MIHRLSHKVSPPDMHVYIAIIAKQTHTACACCKHAMLQTVKLDCMEVFK